ncbi:MAG: aminoglycoside phosphotransferase family protein [Lachnospiraceae bacterium]|nr:aminoglycoside phosphotransferase family protein [Lachnospiraceae bacterium]
MTIQDAKQYLKNNTPILLAGGISGAKVYDIAGEYVLKCVCRAELENVGQYDTYQKEAIWYEYTNSRKSGYRLSYLPEILDIYYTDEELAVLMKCYRTILRNELDTMLLKKIMEVLAAVHTTCIPAFLDQEQEGWQQKQSWKGTETQKQRNHHRQANLLSQEQISASLAGWCSVLDEHPGIFSQTPLKQLAEKINRIIEWHAEEEAVLNHGDFHWDNLLFDKQGNILICDWQGVCVGAASGDLSFFFSRLNADGIYPDEKEVISFYTRKVKQLSGKILDLEEICQHMDAADIVTSFVFWHEYLHGNDVDRVGGIYKKMVDKFQNFCVL